MKLNHHLIMLKLINLKESMPIHNYNSGNLLKSQKDQERLNSFRMENTFMSTP